MHTKQTLQMASIMHQIKDLQRNLSELMKFVEEVYRQVDEPPKTSFSDQEVQEELAEIAKQYELSELTYTKFPVVCYDNQYHMRLYNHLKELGYIDKIGKLNTIFGLTFKGHLALLDILTSSRENTDG